METKTAWSDAALLLVGHGSSRVASSRETTARLATAIHGLGLFAEVRACFWKEEPFLSLDLVKSRTVYVVPNFAGEGSYTRQLIPRKLGLSGLLNDVSGRRVLYCQPVGCHPGIPALLRDRAAALCLANDLRPHEVSLLIIGHGSRRADASRTPEAVAAAIRATGTFGEVAVAYIEQEPCVADWSDLVRTRQVIAAPLLIAEGMHANEDLPPLFGLSAPLGGPAVVSGHTAWLMGGIGREREVVDMILDQVRRADAALTAEPASGG